MDQHARGHMDVPCEKTDQEQDHGQDGDRDVLPHVGHGLPGVEEGRDQLGEAGFDQDDVRHLDGHLGTAADGDPYIGPGQSRTVIDPIAHEGHAVPTSLQVLNEVILILGKEAPFIWSMGRPAAVASTFS